VWFASGPLTGWVDIAKLNPLEACVLAKEGEGLPREQLYRGALRRAVRLASPGADGRGVPSGLEALWAYAADVADPWKGFAQTGGRWFRWAGRERLSARACCAVWLSSAADVLGPDARQPLLDAAAEYGRAAHLYHSFWLALRGLADEGDELAAARRRSRSSRRSSSRRSPTRRPVWRRCRRPSPPCSEGGAGLRERY